MKRIVTTLLFVTGLLAVATVSKAPAAAQPQTQLASFDCCGDPYPVCPPFCDPPPPPGGGSENR